jgi:hypothetical protein
MHSLAHARVMMEMIPHSSFGQEHPLDIVEQLALREDWNFERDGADEIALKIEGRKADYDATFTWLGDIEALHFSCSFPLTVSEARLVPVMQLLRKLNEQLWIGHFDYWPRENMVLFRHSMLLPNGTPPTSTQCAKLLQHGTEACERYFDAFELTNWGGQPPDIALSAALLQTVGRA